jgi:flotillin
MEESYAAQQAAEEARANLERAKLEADILVKAEIRKKEIELQAEAEAEETRRRAKGEADAIIMKMQAEAEGIREMLTKQAEGLSEVVKASGGDANDAVRLMVADKLEELTKIQVEAISKLKIDKITVWDNGNSKDGKTTTANFLSGMMKSVPPMQELFDMAGMQLPEYLGKKNDAPAVDAPAVDAE